jgi:imidazolonepropionase-like amidohydrolase
MVAMPGTTLGEGFSDAQKARQRQAAEGLDTMMTLAKKYGAKIGVIEPGAFADLLILDGNPLEDISVMTRPEENLRIIMKGGVTYKNTLN